MPPRQKRKCSRKWKERCPNSEEIAQFEHATQCTLDESNCYIILNSDGKIQVLQIFDKRLLHPIIATFSDITDIVLKNISVPRFPTWLGDLKNLKDLYFDNSPLKTIPSFVYRLKSLESLGFVRIPIFRVPEKITKSLKPWRLYFEDIPFEEVPPSLYSCRRKISLFFDNCPIKECPPPFPKPENIKLTIYGSHIKILNLEGFSLQNPPRILSKCLTDITDATFDRLKRFYYSHDDVINCPLFGFTAAQIAQFCESVGEPKNQIWEMLYELKHYQMEDTLARIRDNKGLEPIDTLHPDFHRIAPLIEDRIQNIHNATAVEYRKAVNERKRVKVGSEAICI